MKSYKDRFWSRVDKSGECWTWTGSRNRNGYGEFYAGRQMRAHRYSWSLIHGPIPTGMLICHHCDNPPCVRPDHLFLGTDRDNTHDMIKKGRWNGGYGSMVNRVKTQCVNGHPFDAANTYTYKSGRKRGCRQCIAARYRARYRKARAAGLRRTAGGFA